ncbi:hypothetical protein DXG03_005638 [Asterophora parasitica]|uniref:Uncharacterized protein n=1 Tax=Asterophora parasitica TaxID=117018 RepID=A0A9P7G7R5_9AGAR|nr:hypothetical protein DXG03_005638 [Asterophora parasitica]
MLPQTRQLWKDALSWARIKLIYTRITLTRFTTLYFFFALLNCLVLVILQGVAFADNAEAVRAIGGLLSEASVPDGLPIFSNGVLQMCDSVPGQPSTTCTIVFTSIPQGEPWNRLADGEQPTVSYAHSGQDNDDDDGPARARNGSGRGEDASAASIAIQNVPCAQTMMWLQDVLEDAKREDIVTLFFNFWLFSIAVVTVLNESLPHLGASLAGHILGTAWAAYRITSTWKLRRTYVSLAVNGTCQIDFMGDWWELRGIHTIPILVVNVVALAAMGYLSFMLFKGWNSVRREGHKRFIAFSVISLFLILVSTLMFSSALSDALEDVNFTPVYFSNDSEKATPTFNVNFNKRERYSDEKSSVDMTTAYVQQPVLAYSPATTKAPRGQSVYSESSGVPVQLSSTPSLFQERDRAASRAASTRKAKAFRGTQLNLGEDGYAQPQMPPRSATSVSTRSRMSTRSRDLTRTPSARSSGSFTPPSTTRSPTPTAAVARQGLPSNPQVRSQSPPTF